MPLQIVAEIGDLVQSTTLSQSYQQLGASTYVQADANGDKLADFSIALVGTFTLEADDFVL